ncbi:MAG: hypothetical protein IPK85_00295 [Gemmatimonadetes bacterium]|nr:hypothetical protein [Gemmatimonadota bacterium]
MLVDDFVNDKVPDPFFRIELDIPLGGDAEGLRKLLVDGDHPGVIRLLEGKLPKPGGSASEAIQAQYHSAVAVIRSAFGA